MRRSFPNRLILPLALLGGSLTLSIGCKQQKAAEQPTNSPSTTASNAPIPTPPNDQQIASGVQSKISGESALNGQNIQVNVASGVVTLNGSVDNDASRALAAADSGSVDGVRTVINNLTVTPPKVAKTPPAKVERRPKHQQEADLTPPPPPPPAQPVSPPPQEPVQAVPPPPPPPAPVVKTVTLQAGTVIPIRMTDTLDSASTQPNSTFHGSLATDLIVDGMVAAPRGSLVVGRVVVAKDATHFSGSSELSLELTSIQDHGQQISMVTDTFTKQGAGRGKNTAMKAGGGAALGAIIGALAGGGKGAAIGAASGGAIGTGVNGVTRGQQVQIPSETLVNFKLQSPVAVTTSKQAGSSRRFDADQGPQLQQPPQ